MYFNNILLKILNESTKTSNSQQIEYRLGCLKSAENGNFKKIKECLANGVDVNARDICGYTALMLASKKGHFEIVKYLVEHGADVNVQDNWDWTALINASHNGHLEIVKYLVANGADVNAKNDSGWTALEMSKTDEIWEYLKPKVSHINKNHALINCANRGNLEQIKYFLANGADVNAKNDSGWTALEMSKTDEIWEYLKPKVSHINKNHALINCANRGNLEQIKYFLANGADVNFEYSCILSYALLNKHLEVAKYFIANGLYINTQSISLSEIYEVDLNKEAREFLRLYVTFFESASNGNLEAIKECVLQNDVFVNAKNNNGETALVLASINGHFEIVKYLVEHGADVNVQDKWDWTALINASHNGHLEIVKYLVANGADVSIKNNNDETALDKAETDEIKKY